MWSWGGCALQMVPEVGWAGLGGDRWTKGPKELPKPSQEQQDPPRRLQKSGPTVLPRSARWIARGGGTASMAY